MVDWPDSLIRELADRRVLLFVGSGISKAAQPSMPTWPALIKSLSECLSTKKDKQLVHKMIRQNNLLDAAQIVSDGVEKAEQNKIFRETFDVKPTPHHEIYRSLLELDTKTIVTTNYDEFLEKNFEYFSDGNASYFVCRYTSSDLIDNLRSPQRTIVKAHGCITELSGVVLDRTSYFNARQKYHGFFSVLSSLFTVNTVLFLGCSLGDPDIQIIFENIHLVSESTHSHYALISRQDHRSVVNSLRKTYNIKCVEYAQGQHQLVPEIVADLARSVKGLRAQLGIV